jgi:hypothetical protein
MARHGHAPLSHTAAQCGLSGTAWLKPRACCRPATERVAAGACPDIDMPMGDGRGQRRACRSSFLPPSVVWLIGRVFRPRQGFCPLGGDPWIRTGPSRRRRTTLRVEATATLAASDYTPVSHACFGPKGLRTSTPTPSNDLQKLFSSSSPSCVAVLTICGGANAVKKCPSRHATVNCAQSRRCRCPESHTLS